MKYSRLACAMILLLDFVELAAKKTRCTVGDVLGKTSSWAW